MDGWRDGRMNGWAKREGDRASEREMAEAATDRQTGRVGESESESWRL